MKSRIHRHATHVEMRRETVAKKRVRRTQDERSAATRALLLDATVACLHELGYANTTTTVIADRAGVSRGAQLHHFPTKKELVTTAVEHILEKRLHDFRSAFASLPADTPDKLGAVIDLLWKGVDSPAFYAWLELAVAARTDKALRRACARIDHRFNDAVKETFRNVFGMPQSPSPFDVAPSFALLLLQGLAIDKMVLEKQSKAESVLKVFKALAKMGMRGLV